jgi:phytanoyl-CoA hydroxylase
MNKPAGRGTILPWHQDGGNVWSLDRDPLLTTWVALVPATQANGCMDCIPGSHQLGLLSQFGSTVSDENAKMHCLSEHAHPLEETCARKLKSMPKAWKRNEVGF